jgi:biopolymer transport protein ExbD
MLNRKKKISFDNLAEINMTPLIDVLLVLLVILLVTIPAINQAQNLLNLDLPQNLGTKQYQKLKSVNLAINQDSVFFIDGKASTIKELENYLTKIEDKNIQIQLSIENNVKFLTIALVLDILQRLNLKNLAFVSKSSN